MSFTNHQKKKPEESNLENNRARKWVSPSSYCMIRKLPVQKGKNTTGGVRWYTI
jgi:hypothetical protein